MKSNKSKKNMFLKKITFGGITSIGEKGQVVIPSEARKSLKLNKGDKLIVLLKGEKFLVLVKADEISKELKKWLSKLENENK